MNVSYLEPLRHAWSRMMRMLFRPARLGFWFTLGFAAFLSEYLSWGMSGARSGLRSHSPSTGISVAALERVVDFLRHPWVMTLVVWIVALSFVAYLLCMWLSARGRFIFLDNVAHERTGIVEPWRRFQRLGDSLFLFKLGFTLLCLAAAGAMIAPFLAALAGILHSHEFRLSDLYVLLPLPLMFIPFGIFAAYIALFTTSFVVPIMYKHDLGVMPAWGRFLDLFRRHPLPFLLYGLFALALLAVGFCLAFAFGLGTLFIGFLLMATPYIGSVVLLPLEVIARALGPEFLAQFGPEYAVLDAPRETVAPVAGTTANSAQPAH